MLVGSRKRKREAERSRGEEENDDEWEELPHNMGRVRRAQPTVKKEHETIAKSSAAIPAAENCITHENSNGLLHKEKKEEEEDTASEPKKKGRKASVKKAEEDDVGADLREEKVKATKKATYGLTPGVTPFPDYARPSPEECFTVHEALKKAHADCRPRPKTIPEPSKVVAGCGEVRAVLDATIRTVLSAATTSGNANNAYQGMLNHFGTCEVGNGKGSVDYNAVRKASVEDLELSIRRGGLSKNKSKSIKAILDTVFEWNQARLKELLNAKALGPKAFASVGTKYESEAMKEAEIALAKEGILSLDRYHTWPKYEAMFQFVQLPGVGVKTAACIALFCMQRDCFAVDTHVFRMSQWLGWVPEQYGKKKVDRDTTFSHLEVRIPDELKYDLHQLFITHGKKCPRCRAATGETSEGWELGCPIDHLLKRTGPRKTGSLIKKSAIEGSQARKKSKKANSDSEDDEASMPDLDDQDDDKVEAVMSNAENDEQGEGGIESIAKRGNSTAARAAARAALKDALANGDTRNENSSAQKAKKIKAPAAAKTSRSAPNTAKKVTKPVKKTAKGKTASTKKN